MQAEAPEPLESGVQDAQMSGTPDVQEGPKKRRPGRREREQLKGSKMQDADLQCDLQPGQSLKWRPPHVLLGCTLVLLLVGGASLACSFREDPKVRLLKVQQQEILDAENRHLAKLKQPAEIMQKTLDGVLNQTRQEAVDHEAVISKLDSERFHVQHGAWKFSCNAADLEASARAKLVGFPEPVVEKILGSLLFDLQASADKKDFSLDGRSSVGHMYRHRLQSAQSNGVVSVALMVYGVDFDMKKVVDHYEEIEEPVYETAPGPTKRCTTRSVNGPLCVFPFWYKGIHYSRCTTAAKGLLWCATSTYEDGSMYHWDYCGDKEDCQEETSESPEMVRKFVGMAKKKFPVYSHRALPEGVSEGDLDRALDYVSSRDARRALSE